MESRETVQQPCYEVEFLYFGLQFYWLRTQADDIPLYITLDGLLNLRGGDELKKAITEDVKKLKHAHVGQRQAYRPIGTFARLSGRQVYVCKHVDHA